MTETPLYPLSEFTTEEAAKLAEFDAAPTPPEVLREQVAAAIYAVEHTRPLAKSPASVRGQFLRLADAALAVFRDQQDPALQRVLREAAAELRSGGYELAPSNGYPCFDCEDRVAEWLESRAAIGGDGR